MLTEVHKDQGIPSTLPFIETYDKNSEYPLHPIVTTDKTWVKQVKYEAKESWGNTRSPKNPMKCFQTLSARKMMVTDF